MRAKLQRGKDTQQLAVPVDLEDLEALLAYIGAAPLDTERTKFVQISRELLAMLSADWSRPLRIRIGAERGDVLTLMLQEGER
jgi:hypothetical protein